MQHRVQHNHAKGLVQDAGDQEQVNTLQDG
jgi:hypothetical protein